MRFNYMKRSFIYRSGTLRLAGKIFYLSLIITIFSLKNIQGQCYYEASDDTILIINDIGIKLGIQGFISEDYLLSTDSLYFYKHSDWKIIEFSMNAAVIAGELSETSHSNKITEEMKDIIKDPKLVIFSFGYFKIMKKNGDIFEIKKWFGIFPYK